MKMTFTEEQQMLKETVKKFFEKEAQIEQIRKTIENDAYHDEALWKKMSHTGWNAINIEEQYGGVEGSLIDLAIIVEQAGRALVPTTFYSTIYAKLVLNQLATKAQKEKLLGVIAEGSRIATVAFEEKNALNEVELFNTTAVQFGEKWVINGEKYFVQQAGNANYILVVAKVQQHFGIFLVERETNGVEITMQHTIDGSYFGIVKLNNVEVSADQWIGKRPVKKEEIKKSRSIMTALQAVEMAGGSAKVIEMTIDYVKERKQFGVAIGTFQAVQHHLSNLYTQAVGAKLAAYKAISYLETNESAEREVSIAKLYTSTAYVDITLTAHQLWAGMGYSTESHLFLWSNRAKTTQLTFGSVSYHRKKLANIIREKAIAKSEKPIFV